MLTQAAASLPLTTEGVLAEVFRESSSSAGSTGREDKYVHVIHQGAEPRWIIVGAPSKAMPVLGSWAPWKTSSRIRWNAVKMAAATNLLPKMPGVQSRIMQIDTSYWRTSLPQFPEPWNAVIHVGNASPSRKAILFLIENGKQVVCASKIPLVRGAAEAIFNEAEMLDLLREFDYLPRVIFRDRARGVTAQSWLPGRPVARGFSQAHLDLLKSLARAEGTVRVSDSLQDLNSSLSAADFPYDRSVLAHGLELLDCDVPLRCFVEHRDFAPWNLKWLHGEVLGLLDWEWAVPRGLPWQDACRHFYVDDAHFGGSGKVWEALQSNELLLRYRREFDLSAASLPSLTMQYLLREFLTQWEGGNEWLASYAISQIRRLIASVSAVRA